MGLFDSLNFGNILRTSKVFGEVKSQTTNKTDKAEENIFEKNNESDAFVKSTDGGSKDDIAIKNSQEEVMKKVKENVKDYSEETTKDGGALQTSASALSQSFKENINNSDIYNDPTVVGVSKDIDQSVVIKKENGNIPSALFDSAQNIWQTMASNNVSLSGMNNDVVSSDNSIEGVKKEIGNHVLGDSINKDGSLAKDKVGNKKTEEKEADSNTKTKNEGIVKKETKGGVSALFDKFKSFFAKLFG